MSCSKPKCRTKGDEPMVACWLCNDIYHAKCVDLAPRTADNLREDKGLRWCCKKCMVYDVAFFSFLKNTNAELDYILTDLNNLTNKFLKYKELFDKAPCSPKRKKNGNAVNTDTSSLNNSKKSNNIADTDQVNSHPSTPSASTVLISSQPPPQVAEKQMFLPTASTSTTLISPQPQQQVALKQTFPSSSDSLSYSSAFRLPSPQNSQSSQFMLPITTLSQNNPIPCIKDQSIPLKPNSNAFAPKAVNSSTVLKVVSPKKTIFAARFAPETTTDAVINYVKQKIGRDIDILVFKFKYSEQRSKSSFKIIVPEENFDTIVNPDFWPPKAIIHEYVYRNNPHSEIAYLPTENNGSKN